MLILALFAAGALSARAADTRLIVSGDPAAAVARLSGAIGVPADQIKAVPLSDALPGGLEAVVGPGRLEACSAPATTTDDLRVAVEAAERHLAYVELDQAAIRLDAAARLLECLSEPLDPRLAARISFLRGIVDHSRGDATAEEADFRQAFAYQPDLKWDDNYPPDAITLFDLAATPSAAPGHLVVVPSPSALFIDGIGATAAGLAVPAGVHVVQYGEPLTSRRVFVDPGGAVALIRLQSVPTDAVKAWSADPSLHEDLGIVLSAAFGTGAVVYIDDGASTWQTTTGSSDWTAIAGLATLPPGTAPPEAPKKAKKPKKP